MKQLAIVIRSRRWGPLALLAVLAALLGGLLSAAPAPALETVNRVIASVDGDPITMRDLVNWAASMNIKLPSNDAPLSVAQQRVALKAMISQTMLEHEIDNVQVDDATVDRFIATMEAQNHVSDDQLRSQLAAHGMSYEDYRRKARRQVARLQLIQQQVRDKIVITNAQVAAYYKVHRNEFINTQERYKLAQILIAVPAGSPPTITEALRAKAAGILKQARDGANFNQLARKYSNDDSKAQGGELGYFTPNDILDQIRVAIVGLKPGQITDLVRSSHGFHIILVEQHEMSGPKPLAEVSEQIRQKLESDQMDSAFKRWVSQDLSKNHSVQIYL